jgi:hypothetical protein
MESTSGAALSVIGSSGKSATGLAGSTTSGPGEASVEPIDVLSASSVNTFLRCAKQWEYAYVYDLKRPPNLKMVSGTAGHEAVEIDLRQKMETSVDLPQDVVLDAYSTAYEREVVDAFEEPDKGLTRGSVKDTGIRQVTKWLTDRAPEIQPMLVEEPISFDVEGIPFTGTLDLAETNRLIRDHKFSHKTPSSAEQYLLNMVGYAIGFRITTGMIESRVMVDSIVGLKTKVNLVSFSSDGPVSDGSIRAFVNIIKDVNRSVQAGIFPPTGIKSGACSWCGYKAICPAYKDSPMKGSSDKEFDDG